MASPARRILPGRPAIAASVRAAAGQPGPRPRTRPAPGRPLAPNRGTARLVMPRLVLFVIGAGAAAVIALWWQSTPPIYAGHR